jgi:hypothetical protein
MEDDDVIDKIIDFVDETLETKARYPTPDEIVTGVPGVSPGQATETLRAICTVDDDYNLPPDEEDDSFEYGDEDEEDEVVE